jgi:hypothetical protein
MKKQKPNQVNRRVFLQTTGAAGLAYILTSTKSALAASEPIAAEVNDPNLARKPQVAQVPKRKLGKSGALVPCLSIGVSFNAVEKQQLLSESLKWGVSYWDTTDNYAGGNSELGIGKFISGNPQLRKKLFLVTKSAGTAACEDLENGLRASLERMKTEYVDLYLFMNFGPQRGHSTHGLSDPAQLTEELKQWAESAKKRGLIRLFGFSTHKNMAQCLTAAAALSWVDAVMTSYNFRLMQKPEMEAAVEACHKAGVGVIAMKTLGFGQKIETEEDKKLAEHFLQRGFTSEQAKIKAVLQDERISSACVGMDNSSKLTANVAAVLDKTELSQTDLQALGNYARVTCSSYCAGCGHVCDSVSGETPYVSEVMRQLMYYNSYGLSSQARELFARLPVAVRTKLSRVDYHAVEAVCPQRLQIGQLMAEAMNKLA